MRNVTLGTLLLTVLLLGWPAGAGGAPLGYTANFSIGTVTVFDTATNSPTAFVVPEGGLAGLEGIAVHPDGTRAYVTNLNSGNVSVINTAFNQVTATVPVGGTARGVAVHPDGTRVYVTNSSDDIVAVIDTATDTVTATVALANPRDVAVHPDGTKLYVTQIDEGTVSVIDAATNTVTATIQVGMGANEVAIHPDGTRAYVTNGFLPTVSVIDTANNTVTATVGVGQIPRGVAVHPDGTQAYVANSGEGTVSVIDTATNSVIVTVRVGNQPFDVAVHPAGTHVYVTNNGDATVSVITLALLLGAVGPVTATVNTGKEPRGIAIDPRPGVFITTNASTYQAGDQFTVSVSTTAGDPRSNQWFLIVALVTPVNTSAEPFFVFRFDPAVELLTIQDAVARVGQGSFADIAARPLQTVSTQSFTILDIAFPQFPAGSYQWLAILFKEDLSSTSEAASASFTAR